MNSSLEERLLASKEEAVSLMESARCEIGERWPSKSSGSAEAPAARETEYTSPKRSAKSMVAPSGEKVTQPIFLPCVHVRAGASAGGSVSHNRTVLSSPPVTM